MVKAISVTLPSDTLSVLGDTSAIKTYTWSKPDKLYAVSNDTLIVHVYGAYQSRSKQLWTNCSENGSTSTTWNANGSFKGSTYYGNNGGNAAKTRSSRIYFYQVTNCIGAAAYVKSQSSRSIQISAYEVESGPSLAASPAKTASDNSNKDAIISITGLDKDKTYLIAIDGNNSSDCGYVYEVAFVAAPAVTYTVTYDLGEGTGTTPTESKKAAGAKFNLHDGVTGITAPTDKVFAGWNDGTNTYTGGALYTMPSTAVVFTAQWSNIFSVTYKAGEGVGEDVIVSPATTIDGCPNTFTAPDGKVFAGWKTIGGTSYAVGDFVTESLTLIAQWVATHTVTYDLNGCTVGSAPTHDPVAEGSLFDVATLSASTYLWKYNWSDGSDIYEAGASYTMGTSDVTLTAQWSDVAFASVSAATTWDWTKVGSSLIQLKDDTYPTKASEDYIVFANIKGINNNADFNSAALEVKCEYPVRDGKYFQGGFIKLNTTVAGLLTVTYSNTGNRSNEDDRRFLNVNGTNYGEGTMKSNETVTTSVPVDAGEITIKGTLKKDSTDQYLRINKIVFIPVVELTLGANGYSTYAADYKYTVSGAQAYMAAYDGDKDAVVLTEVSVVKAGEGVILKGAQAGDVATITPSVADADDFADNKLVGVLTATPAPANAYAIATNVDGDGLTKFHPCEEGIEIPAHKAYIVISGGTDAPIRIAFEENNATALDNLDANENIQKFMENGKLYIIRNGVVYDAMGKMVK